MSKLGNMGHMTINLLLHFKEQCQGLRICLTHITHTTDLPPPEPVAGDATITAFGTYISPQSPTLGARGSSAASSSDIITPSLSVPTSTVTKALHPTSTQSEFASILKQLSPLLSCDESKGKDSKE
ncbi:hypothetical protein QE152_g8625 [Popillia japonica]|uniref:Uncharacterized protein n=1 Tax=Popillia japonica TaxID=7064 RepID=A0AAW1M093_POPJA